MRMHVYEIATSPGLSEPDFNHKNGASIDHTRCAYFGSAMILFLEHFPKNTPPLIGGYAQLNGRSCTQPGPEKRGPGWILGWAERQGHARPPAGPVATHAGRSLPAAMRPWFGAEKAIPRALPQIERQTWAFTIAIWSPLGGLPVGLAT